MIDWAQIITAVCTGLTVAVPAVVSAYIGWRKFRAENNAANAQILERQTKHVAVTTGIARTQEALVEVANGNMARALQTIEDRDRQIEKLVAEAVALKAELDAAQLRAQQLLTKRISDATPSKGKK